MPSRSPWVGVVVASLPYFMTFVDSWMLLVALPVLADPAQLPGSDGGKASWLWVFFSLASAVMLLNAGRMGDLWGHRRVTLVGTAAFAGASILSAASPGY